LYYTTICSHKKYFIFYEILKSFKLKPFHIEFNVFFAIIKLIFSDTNLLNIFIDSVYKEVELICKPSSKLKILKRYV